MDMEKQGIFSIVHMFFSESKTLNDVWNNKITALTTLKLRKPSEIKALQALGY